MNDATKDTIEKKREQHRYTSEQEILELIGEAQKQLVEAEKAALFARKLADHYTKRAGQSNGGDAEILLEHANEQLRLSAKLLRRAERIEKKLGQFKRTLAAFRTGDLFGESPVVLQN